ncbi:response regulator [Coleofasciculus sp. LEGE 07081]|uniref:response regulator n=1 Tax=Coleofasciculus sp. LEGE 07081 TaxID=2777967 RepID=UPI001D15A403|nr:response regulator [Coleofasciculus sp. LEGE 07081]
MVIDVIISGSKNPDLSLMLAPSSVGSVEWPIARNDVIFSTEELLKRIQDCANQQFTGQLDVSVSTPQHQKWRLYFSLGSLIGCGSVRHPIRRWYRQLSRHCPHLIVDAIGQEGATLQCRNYECLAALVREGKVMLGQMAGLLESHATELLFDIIQAGELFGYRSGLKLTYRQIPNNVIDFGWVVIRVDQVWQQALETWQAWQQAGLSDYSPNQAPVILQAEKLRQQTSSIAYQNLTILADGKQALRDLAIKLKQNPLPLTHSLLPYIRSGLIGLIEIEDLSITAELLKTTDSKQDLDEAIKKQDNGKVSLNPSIPLPSPCPALQTAPLVAYIDDSRIDSQTMGNVLSNAGYRYINIQDSVQALVQLLEHKPNLIFLDLVMPVANGYEICSQIRRVSVFKNIPVIILTGNDGIVDRVRAKVVGASGFLTKPITQQKVLRVLYKYIPVTKPS